MTVAPDVLDGLRADLSGAWPLLLRVDVLGQIFLIHFVDSFLRGLSGRSWAAAADVPGVVVERRGRVCWEARVILNAG